MTTQQSNAEMMTNLVNSLVQKGLISEENKDSALQLIPPDSKDKGKKKKDPNAPKRPKNPYMLFLEENREDIRNFLSKKNEENGNPPPKISEIAKEAGVRWNAVQNKEIYNKKAEEDTLRYKSEMEKYTSGKTDN